jgi:hypothetical protein
VYVLSSLGLFVALFVSPPCEAAQPAEVVAAVRIQGNVATSDDEILRLAGLEIGMAIGPQTVAMATERLRATKRFEQVEVLKRHASISDPNQIVLVILIDEGAVRIQSTGDPNRPTRVVRSRRLNLQVLPILSGEDGYGLTYGVRLTRPNPAGSGSRLTFPATWGGEKRIAAEFERRFDRGPVTRIETGGSLSAKTNPYFREDDNRRRLWARAERQLLKPLRAGAAADWQHVSFLDGTDRVLDLGSDVVLDTRLDPWLARNAVYATAEWHRLTFSHSDPVDRFVVDARGYVGLFGQSILVARVLRDAVDGPLPDYLKPILGGTANLRGFRAGTAVGDTLVAGSIELRLPLTSPLRLGKLGVSAFTDTGTVYNHGEQLGDQALKHGFGGSVWFAAAFLRLNVGVAHGVGASTRIHASLNVTF